MIKFLTVKITLTGYPGEPGKYSSRMDSSPQGASAGQGCYFSLPAIPTPATSYEEYLKNLYQSPNPVPELRELGKTLYRCIFQDGIRDKWNNVLGQARSQADTQLRIALNILSPELIKVPWEFMHDGNGHLMKDGTTSIVRIIDELVAPRSSFGPISYPLVIIANPGKLFDTSIHVPAIKQEFIDRKVVPANIKVLERATNANIFDFLQENPKADFLYFLGHGGVDGNGDGVIVLESDKVSSGEYFPAQQLGASIKNQTNIRLVYFNSCSTATIGTGTFSGVAQNVMLYGGVDAVIGMQAPVLSSTGMDFATLFIRKIMQVETVEEALTKTRYHFLKDNFTWAIPVIYSHQVGPENFEKNQTLSLLGLRERDAKYALCLPSFRNTLLEEELANNHYDIQIKVDGKDVDEFYHYPGLSFAQSDVTATNYIRQLLLKVTSLENIRIIAGVDIKNEAEAACIFLFGSRSNSYVSEVLSGYSAPFQLVYNDVEWFILDHGFKKKYAITPPYKFTKEQFDSKPDYCCIQKITTANKIYFLISGLGDRGTVGGSWWIANNWRSLLLKAGTADFSYLLRLPTSSFASAELMDRVENNWGTNVSD